MLGTALLLQLTDVRMQGAAGWAISPLFLLQPSGMHVLQVVVAAETQRAPILQTEGANVQPGKYQTLRTEAACCFAAGLLAVSPVKVRSSRIAWLQWHLQLCSSSLGPGNVVS